MKNTLKRVLALLLTIVMTVGIAPLSGVVGLELPKFGLPEWFDFSMKAEAETQGIYTYTVSNGKTTITKCDASASGNIIIPSTLGGYSVTGIAAFAFEYCDNITSVTIPNTFTSIDNYAFSGCAGLKSVTIGKNVTSIGTGAFYNCISLISVTIPDGVTSIGKNALCNCGSLTSVTIPSSVKSIDNGGFYSCNNLIDVYYTGDIKSWCGRRHPTGNIR